MVESTTKLDHLITLLCNIFGKYYGYRINEYEPNFHYERTGQIGFDCPVCSEIKNEPEGDGKGNLEVNYYKGIYKCWSCFETHNTSGTIKKLIKNFGDNSDLKIYNLLNLDYDYEVEESLFEEWNDFSFEVPLPDDFVNVFELEDRYKYNQIMSFLKKERKLSDEKIKKHNIGYTEKGIVNEKPLFKDMIIFPSYNKENELNYFVGRKLNGNSKYMLLPKKVMPKHLIVYNEYFIDWSKTVFIVEGVLDHLSIPNSIPLLGKYLNRSVWESVYYNAKNNVIILLDGEAIGAAEKIYQKLNGGKLLNRVFINNLDNDDPSSFYQKYGIEGWRKQIKKKSYKI